MWVIEIDYGGINWEPIAWAVSEYQAKKLAEAPHILEVGKPVRVREYGKPAAVPQS
jgi:hypothetical protein